MGVAKSWTQLSDIHFHFLSLSMPLAAEGHTAALVPGGPSVTVQPFLVVYETTPGNLKK